MKTINLLATWLFAATILSSGSANGKERPALMVDANKGSSKVMFSPAGPSAVSGIQFDIKLNPASNSMARDEILTNCVSGLPSTHRGSCSFIDENTVRVLIFSLQNLPLPAAALSSFPVNIILIEESVVAGTAEAQKVNIDVLNIPAGNGRSNRPVIGDGKAIQQFQ